MSLKHDELMERVLERVEDRVERKVRGDCHHYPNKLEPVKGSWPLKLRCRSCGAVVPAIVL
jgi:hypothetical protein